MLFEINRLPVIVQSELAECGLACLAMVASFYGYHSNLTSLRKKFNLSMTGTGIIELAGFSEELSLSSRIVRIELEELSSLQTPCILHWDLNHFVVLKSTSSRHIVIHDPSTGTKKIPIDEVSNSFTGIVLELTPAADFKIHSPLPKLKLSDFWTQITGLKRSLTGIFLVSSMLLIFNLINPFYLQLIIDDVLLTEDISLLFVLTIGFILILVFETATNAIRSFSILHFSNQMNLQLGTNLFHHLIRLPINYFEKRHMGDIVSRFGSLSKVKQLLTTGIIEAVIDGLMALITLTLMFYYGASLALIVVSAVILYLALRVFMYDSFKNISEKEIVAKAEETSNFMEVVRGIQTIKLFSAEQKRESDWKNKYVSVINQSINIGKHNITYDSLNKLLFGLENIVVIVIASTMIISGEFSVGMLFAFIAYKKQFVDKAANLVDKFIEFKMLSLYFERLSDLVLTEKEILNPPNIKKHLLKGKIELKDVSFKYSDTSQLVVNQISFCVFEGESVAITGPSGCGKSTIMKLMLGLVEPESGVIEIDDVQMKEIGDKQYREQVAAVMQNDELISGSISDNISFFNSNVTLEQVIECAKLAHIHDDIDSMAMGYDSLVGDMGSSLSGGQKQRVMIARALCKKPKILFLDEATSHLDSKLENKINNEINKLKITRVMVAHRKETILSADRVINIGPKN